MPNYFMGDIALIDDLYNRLGITQQSLAKLLGIHQGVLSKIGDGKRPLPIKATYPLVQIHAITHQLPAASAPLPSPADTAALQQQLTTCQIQVHQLQKQLQHMQHLYHQGNALLQFVQAYTPTLNNATAKQQRLLEELTFQANKKIKANGWLPQQQLQLKITLLLTEIEFLKAQLQSTI